MAKEANTKRIVIASQYGSESLGVDGKNQYVVGNSNSDPVTYDPSASRMLLYTIKMIGKSGL